MLHTLRKKGESAYTRSPAPLHSTTKHFIFSGNQVGLTAGVAHSPQRCYNRNMNGFFADLDYRLSFLPQLDVMAEYDSHET